MCKHRTQPRGVPVGTTTVIAQAPAAKLGEKGFMKLKYTGAEPQTIYGEITDHPYNWNRQRVQFVDRRDAVFMLGVEYMPC